MPDTIQATGTRESLWERWSDLDRLPPYPLGGVGSVLVLAAHPDDELLGVGGTLAMLAAAGVRLRVVVATDAEEFHPHGTRAHGTHPHGEVGGLGLDPHKTIRVINLGLPDRDLADHEGELTEIAGRMMRGFSLCLAPWTGDLHPDHEAVGRAAARAAGAAGIPVCQYPVWMWHWATPADPRVPWHRAARIELGAWAMAAKEEAVACPHNPHHRAPNVRGPSLPGGPEAGCAERLGNAAMFATEELKHFRRRYEVVFT